MKTHYDVSRDQALHCFAFHNSVKLVIASVEPAKYFHLFIFYTLTPPTSTALYVSIRGLLSLFTLLGIAFSSSDRVQNSTFCFLFGCVAFAMKIIGWFHLLDCLLNLTVSCFTNKAHFHRSVYTIIISIYNILKLHQKIYGLGNNLTIKCFSL